MGRGKNALKRIYLHKATALISSEIELFMLKIRHPEQFVYPEHNFNSNLRVDKRGMLGLIGFYEVAHALFLSGNILGIDGQPANEKSIANAFEMIFNIKFGDLSKKKEAIFSRYKCTKALSTLKELIKREKDKLEEG